MPSGPRAAKYKTNFVKFIHCAVISSMDSLSSDKCIAFIEANLLKELHNADCRYLNGAKQFFFFIGWVKSDCSGESKNRLIFVK
jgi:hypothetical protein